MRARATTHSSRVAWRGAILGAGLFGAVLAACTPSSGPAPAPTTTTETSTSASTTTTEPPASTTTIPRAPTTTAPPLDPSQLIRQWSFTELTSDELSPTVVAKGIQVDGLLHELFDYGPAMRDHDTFFPMGHRCHPTASPPVRWHQQPTG